MVMVPLMVRLQQPASLAEESITCGRWQPLTDAFYLQLPHRVSS